jgi:TonB-linked SusC/RagA family outer membrane protein
MDKNTVNLSGIKLLTFLLFTFFIVNMRYEQPFDSLKGMKAVTDISGDLSFQVNGQVTDDVTGDPLPGVNVKVKGTTIGAATDAKGHYQLTAPNGADMLVFSYIGYKSKTVPINDQSTINIKLATKIISGKQLVVVGYGKQKKKYVSGSISSVTSEEVENQTKINVLGMLRGRVAGFSTIQSPGPGGGGSAKIRGTTSILATSSPLIVVDDTPYHGSLSEINPNDIKSIDVLKGASAAAVYGSRAAAGVIEITTKKGEQGKPKINIRSTVGMVNPDIQQRPFGPMRYAYYKQASSRYLHPNKPANYYTNPDNLPSGMTVDEWTHLDPSAKGSPEQIWLNRLGFKSNEIKNYLAGNSIDWYDQIVRTGIRQNYNASISGGGDALTYYTSLQYIDNQGMRLNERYKTYRVRANLDYNVTSYLLVGIYSKYENTDTGFLPASINSAVVASPWGDKYDEDGTLKWYTNGDNDNPNPYLYTLKDYYHMHHSLRANIHATLDLPAGFTFKTRWVNRFAFGQQRGFTPRTHPSAVSKNGSGYRDNSTAAKWSIDNILKWKYTVADIHHFDLTFVHNATKYKNWSTSASNQDFSPNDALIYHNIGSGQNPEVSSNDKVSTGVALVGRINYRLLDRYILNVSFRRDGYSAFGEKHPYAYFPAVSAAWRISDENFFDVNWISNLKLRFGYGVNGNRSIGPYSALATLSTTKYIYGNETYTGIYPSRMENANLKWERTAQYDGGIDFGFLSGRLSGSIDVYKQITTNLLLNRSLPDLDGFTNVTANIGQMNNRGLEIHLESTNINKHNFQWKSMVNFSLDRNKIIHLYGNMVPVKNKEGEVIGHKEASDIQNGWYIGHSLHAIKDYKYTHVYTTDEAEQAAIYGRKPGYFAVKDINQDSVYLPKDDYVFQGYTVPQYYVNLNNTFTWKNLDISFLIRSLLDYKGVNNHHLNRTVHVGRSDKYAYPYWTKDNQRPQWAALKRKSSVPGSSANYYESRSFVRLQNFSVGYTVPHKWIPKSIINNFKIFFNLKNGPIWTDWTYWDPESQGPMPRIYTFGLDITL